MRTNTNTRNRVRNPIVRLARAIRNLIRRRGTRRVEGYAIARANYRNERAYLNRLIALEVGGANNNNIGPATYLVQNAAEVIVLPNVTLYLPTGQNQTYRVYTGQTQNQNGNGNNQNQTGQQNQNRNQNQRQNQGGGQTGQTGQNGQAGQPAQEGGKAEGKKTLAYFYNKQTGKVIDVNAKKNLPKDVQKTELDYLGNLENVEAAVEAAKNKGYANATA